MENRREFLKVSAAAALVSNQVRGANVRAQMGIIMSAYGDYRRLLETSKGS